MVCHSGAPSSSPSGRARTSSGHLQQDGGLKSQRLGGPEGWRARGLEGSRVGGQGACPFSWRLVCWLHIDFGFKTHCGGVFDHLGATAETLVAGA